MDFYGSIPAFGNNADASLKDHGLRDQMVSKYMIYFPFSTFDRLLWLVRNDVSLYVMVFSKEAL